MAGQADGDRTGHAVSGVRRAPDHDRARDGLSGAEGTFLLCTFWLAQAQALAGEVEAATATFERAVAAINDVGLLAEEAGPGQRRDDREPPAGVQPHRADQTPRGPSPKRSS
jgi:GH15 family glucan-1,4-alpha-glucosidase